MASIDCHVFQRLFVAGAGMRQKAFLKRRVSRGGRWASLFCGCGAPEVRDCADETAGWSWSECVAPFGVRDVRVRHHALSPTRGGQSSCPATGWGMVVSGRALLDVCLTEGTSPRSNMLHAGDVWSVPSSVQAKLRCHKNDTASVVAFIGGRETTSKNGMDPFWHWSDAAPQGSAFCHDLFNQQAEETSWGSIRVVEANRFSDPDALSAAFVEIRPACSTTMHWHLNTAEWQVGLSGTGCLVRLPAGHAPQKMRLAPGVVGLVPRGEGHFVCNTGDEPLRLLEIFRSDHYHDLSLSQWLAASSVEEIAAHLCVDVSTIATLSRL